MKRILVFQHVAYEILGTLHPLLKKAGFRIRYANFGRRHHAIEMNRYDGLVILGGPMGVYEADRYPHLLDEIKAIQQALHDDKPILGICLGAQLIAAALGANVKRSPNREIGWYDVSLTEEGKRDPVLGELQSPERIFQWHQDSFEIPSEAVWLARSEACPQQAFRYGDKVYGFQFHLEVDEQMIERWLKVPAHRSELEVFGGKDLPDTIRSHTAHHIARLKAVSQKVFSRYIDLVCTKRRTILLGSR
jgi:GMP synthase (glutamine-hydrolysing)